MGLLTFLLYAAIYEPIHAAIYTVISVATLCKKAAVGAGSLKFFRLSIPSQLSLCRAPEPFAKLFWNVASRYIGTLGCVELAIFPVFFTRPSQPGAARLQLCNWLCLVLRKLPSRGRLGYSFAIRARGSGFPKFFQLSLYASSLLPQSEQ